MRARKLIHCHSDAVPRLRERQKLVRRPSDGGRSTTHVELGFRACRYPRPFRAGGSAYRGSFMPMLLRSRAYPPLQCRQNTTILNILQIHVKKCRWLCRIPVNLCRVAIVPAEQLSALAGPESRIAPPATGRPFCAQKKKALTGFRGKSRAGQGLRGGGYGARTRGLDNAIVALSQLS